jgi:hypothetical protein
VDSFNFLISRLDSQQNERDKFLNNILSYALKRNNTEMAAAIMSQNGFRVDLGSNASLYMPHEEAWNVPKLMQFITSPERATALAPRKADFNYIKTVDDVDALVGLSRHCDGINHQETFNATEGLLEFLWNTSLRDSELVEVVTRFLDYGADHLSQEIMHVLNRFHRNQTIAAIQNYHREDIKVTEEEASMWQG